MGVSVNCHGKHWNCTFTRTELERKRKSGLIELLAFENDSYSLPLKDMEKENKMKELDKPENDEKEEIKIPIKEGDLQDSTVSQLMKEKIEKDLKETTSEEEYKAVGKASDELVKKIEIERETVKETVVGRKGHVDEGQAEPKEFTNNELIKKFEEIEHQNRNLMERFVKVWDKITWLERCVNFDHEVLEKLQKGSNIINGRINEIKKQSAENIVKEIEKLVTDFLTSQK